MTSQEIKTSILNYDMTDELLEKYLEIDFTSTITGLLNAIFELLRTYKKNENITNHLLLELENIACFEINAQNLKILDSSLKDLISKIHKYLTPEQKRIISVRINQLKNINKTVREKKNIELSYGKVRLIEDIIIYDRNLKRIKDLIKANSNILDIKDSNEENILYKLLKRYASLESDDKDNIDYFYQVILLFINSKRNSQITKEKEYYLQALGESTKPNILEIKDKLKGYLQKVDLKELEEKYHVNKDYPEILKLELYTFQTKKNNVIDLRYQPCITIDGNNSQCLDDALYIEKNKDGTYTLYIHICYIPAIIPYNSAIREEASKRVSTYYFTDGVSHLYPEVVSNYLASLLPNNNRYAESLVLRLDTDMSIIEDEVKIIKTKINSHHRLTYDKADEILGSRENTELYETLRLLGIFALKRKKNNKQAYIYRMLENLNSENFDPNRESLYIDTSVSANIVQQCMLVKNEYQPKYYKDRNLPYLFRYCDKVDISLIEKELVNIIQDDHLYLREKDWESFKKCISSTYQYAKYSNVPKYHYGLGKEVSSHTTCPARRYADSFCQYIDEDLIFTSNPSDNIVYLWEYRTKEMADYLNKRIPNIEAFCSQYNYLQSKRLIKK